MEQNSFRQWEAPKGILAGCFFLSLPPEWIEGAHPKVHPIEQNYDRKTGWGISLGSHNRHERASL